ncbi:MAG: four helix bundle protein [Candidatus Omnitrophica bacterium]|nr:four helix bundle protein [Candidatus Omnitrophota bacterium]
MSIQKLEDLKVWQEARILMKMVYKIITKFPKSEEYNLKRHMRECARNVMGNIAEGFGRYHFQESIQFYRIARGSLVELKSDSYASFDADYLSNGDLNNLVEQEDKVVKMLNSLIDSTIKLKRKD